MEKQPLAATPGMYSVGLEATVNIGNYENIRVGLVQSFAEGETKHRDAYLFVLGHVTAWADEIHEKYPVEPPPARAPPTGYKAPVREARPGEVPPPAAPAVPVSGKRNIIMDAIRPYLDRVTMTETERAFLVRTRGQMERGTWGDLNTIIRAEGGKWIGTREGEDPKNVHWEIPK